MQVEKKYSFLSIVIKGFEDFQSLEMFVHAKLQLQKVKFIAELLQFIACKPLQEKSIS